MIRLLLATTILLGAVACAGDAAPDDTSATTSASDDLELVRDLTRQFYDRELAQLHARFSAEMQQDFSLEQLTQLRDQVENLYGKETEVLGEESDVRDDYRGFVRWARFERSEGVIAIEWYLRADGQVAGFFVKPATRKINVGS